MKNNYLNETSRTIIAGTGRAGTTLLVRILTKMDIDTGFNDKQLLAAENSIGHARLERIVKKDKLDNLPTVIKSPNLVNELPKILAENWFKIDRAIIPVRQLSDAAKSRAVVSARAQERGHDPRKAPGGLWKTGDPNMQRYILAEQFYKTVETLISCEVPITFLHFPRFANDAEYLVAHLGPYLSEQFGTTDEDLILAHKSETKSELIGGWK